MSISLQMNDTWQDMSSISQLAQIPLDQWKKEADRLKFEMLMDKPTPLAQPELPLEQINTETKDASKSSSSSAGIQKSRVPQSPKNSESYTRPIKTDLDRRRSRERESNPRDSNYDRDRDSRRYGDREYKRRDDYRRDDDLRDNYRRDNYQKDNYKKDNYRRDERPDNRYTRKDDRFGNKDRDYSRDKY